MIKSYDFQLQLIEFHSESYQKHHARYKYQNQHKTIHDTQLVQVIAAFQFLEGTEHENLHKNRENLQ